MANNPNVLDNLTPFKKGQSWNPNWRPMSFKNEFKRMLDTDWWLTIKKEQVVEILPNGDIKIKMPKKEMLVMKAINWAMSNKGTESTKMIQWIIEMIDWKPVTQNVNLNVEAPINNPLDDRLKQLWLY